jgi:hypothetical protein
MDKVVCSGCKTISPIPAYVVAHEFGTFCLQCWKLVSYEYYVWLSGITPTYGISDKENN